MQHIRTINDAHKNIAWLLLVTTSGMTYYKYSYIISSTKYNSTHKWQGLEIKTLLLVLLQTLNDKILQISHSYISTWMKPNLQITHRKINLTEVLVYKRKLFCSRHWIKPLIVQKYNQDKTNNWNKHFNKQKVQHL